MARGPRDLLAFAGSDAGWLAGAAPRARLMYAGVMLGACLLAPTTHPAGLALLLTIVVGTVLLAGTPFAHTVRIGALALVFYLPLVVLINLPHLALGLAETASLLTPGGEGEVAMRVETAGSALTRTITMLVKGVAAMMVTLTAISTLRLFEAHRAIGGLPLPRSVRLLLIQMVHQTAQLIDETLRIRRAIAVRGGGRGAAGLRRAIPGAWLVRVAERAERVASAMELRGYIASPVGEIHGPSAWSTRDRHALALALLALLGASLLRVMA